jgi:outer membrane protein OmpA-like peptidoglycan-associated protein
MKTTNLFILSILLFLSSCEAVKNTNKTQRGAALGTVLGGVLGAVVANNTGGKSEVGAVVGAIAGGVAGGLIGRKMDKQAKEIQEVLPGAEIVKVNNGEGLQVVLDEAHDGIKFAVNSANLDDKTKSSVEKLAVIFKQNPDTNLSVIGHTDDSGSDQLNLQLSIKRANSVANYLSQNGVLRGRITAKGMGESQPKLPNSSETNKAQNRRVEIFITPNEKLMNEAKSESN